MFQIKIVETESGKVIVDAEATAYLLAPLDARGGIGLFSGTDPKLKAFPLAAASVVSDMIKAQFVYGAPSTPAEEPAPQIVRARGGTLPFDPRVLRLGKGKPKGSRGRH